MENPFAPKQIRNYLLLYIAVVVFMVIFYLLNTSFNQVATCDRKIFDEQIVESDKKIDVRHDQKKNPKGSSIRLLKEAY